MLLNTLALGLAVLLYFISGGLCTYLSTEILSNKTKKVDRGSWDKFILVYSAIFLVLIAISGILVLGQGIIQTMVITWAY